MSFADLKRKSKSSIETLRSQLEKQEQPKNYEDDRFWNLQRTKEGNGAAIIRFLPQSEEDLKRELPKPWVEWSEFNFQASNGKWYIEKSLRSLNQPDPMYEYNGELWASGNKEQARKQNQNKKYAANILVVKDPICPENEGKVFLFKFGPQIYKMILDKAFPERNKTGGNKLDELLGEDSPTDSKQNETVDVTNIYTGENLKLKIYKKEDGFFTYDKSSWAGESPLADSDKKIEEIWKQCYCLSDLVAPNQFKTYDELNERVNAIRGISKGKSMPSKPAKQIPTASDNLRYSSNENSAMDDFGDADSELTDDNIAEFFGMAEENDTIPF